MGLATLAVAVDLRLQGLAVVLLLDRSIVYGRVSIDLVPDHLFGHFDVFLGDLRPLCLFSLAFVLLRLLQRTGIELCSGILLLLQL